MTLPRALFANLTKMVLSRLLVSHSNLALALVLLTAPAFAYDNPSRLPLGRFDAEVEIQRHLTRTRPSKCCWDTFERTERRWDPFKRAERRLFLLDRHFNRGFE